MTKAFMLEKKVIVATALNSIKRERIKDNKKHKLYNINDAKGGDGRCIIFDDIFVISNSFDELARIKHRVNLKGKGKEGKERRE